MRWEYWSVAVPMRQDKKVEMLAEAGRVGWELVAVDNQVAYFKRPIVSVERDDGSRAFPMSVGTGRGH